MSAIDKYTRLRTLLVGCLLSLFFAGIASKAVYLQVFKGSWLAQKAANQYKNSVVFYGKRGTVFDAKGQEMAVSVDVTSIGAFPQRIQDARAASEAFAHALDEDRRGVYDRLKSQKSFVWIKRKVTPKQLKAVKSLGLEGIGFIPESARYYPNKTIAAQVVGLTGVDGTGLEGIEYHYDAYLKGAAIEQTILRDALGRGFDAEKKIVSSFSGNNLVLTIDNTIQYIAEKALEETVRTHSAKSGMVVVMEPKTGAVLALAHFPVFNPNVYQDFRRDTWRNRVVTDSFEPGSTMKIFSAAAALESGIASPKTIFFCENGKYRIGKDVVNDVHPHGWLSLQQIVKYSSNIGAVKVTEMIGPEYHYKMLKNFGFGQKTGIDCPGETSGTLTPYEEWSKIDAGAIAFGQGVAVSALQLATAASAIANDGVLMQPYLVHSITDPRGQVIKKHGPRRIRRVLSQKTAQTLCRIMETVITLGGTGTQAAVEGYSVGGKTGTAQKIDASGKYAKGKYIASFLGFAPVENPAVTILVVVDEPRGKYYGGTVAGPAFKQIAQEILSYLNIPPRKGSESLTVSFRGRGHG